MNIDTTKHVQIYVLRAAWPFWVADIELRVENTESLYAATMAWTRKGAKKKAHRIAVEMLNGTFAPVYDRFQINPDDITKGEMI